MDQSNFQNEENSGNTQKLFAIRQQDLLKDNPQQDNPLQENLVSKTAQEESESNAPPKDPSDRESKLPPKQLRHIQSLVPGEHTQSFVEVSVIHESSATPRIETPCKTFEIWTRNRIYIADDSLKCVEVTDRYTGKNEDDHPLLGSRLMGGQKKTNESIELSYPLPKPGSEAIFQHPHVQNNQPQENHFARTSTITRVILRLHITTVSRKSLLPTWEKL